MFRRMSSPRRNPAASDDSLIVSTPGVLGGKPRIRGHRVAVHRIAGWRQLGLTVEEIAGQHPSLGPAEIHAALAYFHLHRAEIDRHLVEERLATNPEPALSAAV